MKVPSSCNVPKNLSASEMETFVAGQSEGDIKKYDLIIPCDGDDGLSHLADGNKKRKKVISWPFTLRRLTIGPDSLGHLESDLKPSLFDQPLSLVCGEEDILPKSIQEMLAILYLKGPLTEGIFRKAANEKARKGLKEELNLGGKIVFEKESVHLLAVVLKDFLRNIPNKLLLSELYGEWMIALEKTNHQKRIEAMKEVADKLPRPHLLLLKHLLCVLHHISKSSEVNKMDSSNLAICIGPNILTPVRDQNLPLEVQKALADKVKTLVEFLIDNCFDIFGEEIALLFDVSEDDSLDRTEMQSPSAQDDSAYSSTDFEGESNLSDLQPSIVPQATCRPMVTELASQQSVAQTVSSLTCFKKSTSNLDRRLSEPDMFSQKGCQEGCIRIQKLTKSDENFRHQEELSFSCQKLRMQMAQEPHLTGLYRNKKPPNLTIETSFQSESPNSPFPRTSSSSSVDSASSVSDSSVFTNSPLPSPVASQRNAAIRRQSFSTKIYSESGTSNRELKKHSASFLIATHKKVLTKTQSCSISSFQRDSFRKVTKKDSYRPCQIVGPTCADNCHPETRECLLRPRFMSADEVFRLVDQRNPGNPPSYEEATKNCSTTRLPSYNSLIIQKMRPAGSSPNFENQHPKLSRDVINRVKNDLFNNRSSVNSIPKDKMPEVEFDFGVHSRANLPLTPQVYRLRTMSGSYQKNKQEYLMNWCSQLAFDRTQCAKESYV